MVHTISRRAAIGAGLAACAAPAFAQVTWPTRQVTVIVPFAAGGTTDLFARIFTQDMQQTAGTPFVVENRAGAGGTVGANAASRAAPDGYTLFVGTASTQASAPFVFRSLPYNPERDFQPISLFATLPNLLVVANRLPVTTVPELVAHARTLGRPLNYGTSGIATGQHLSAAYFETLTGIPMTHIPFRASNEIMNALAGGHIDLAFDNMTLAWPQAQGGTVRAVAVTTLQRSPTAPHIPAVAETFPGFDIGAWHGLFAPAGTPRPVVDRISAEVRRIYTQPAVIQQLKDIGAVASPMAPDDYAAFIGRERDRYREIVKAAKIEPQ